MSLSPSEVITIDQPIQVFGITADSFPDGIVPAHEKFHTLVTPNENRKYFAISSGGEQITYKVAATELYENELRDKNLEPFTIRNGQYLSITVDSPQEIQEAFPILLQDPRLDPEGYCVEEYLADNKVRCMVTLSS